MKGIPILPFLLLFPISLLAGNGLEERADSARNAFDQEEYEKALELYEGIAETHVSPSLYYNIGNAAFRAGNLGEAILNYRKARKRAPWNPDIEKNLELALQKTRDDFENQPEAGIFKAFKDLLVVAPLGNWWTLSLIASILCGSSFLLIAQGGRSKPYGVAALILFLILTLVFYGADRGKESILSSKGHAVILVPSIEVRNSPKAGASTAFVLHEGTSLKVRSKEEEWVRIRTPDDQVGWVERKALGLY